MDTTRDESRSASLVAATLAEAANLAAYVERACADGSAFAREHGATSDNVRDAREVLARVAAVVEFINGGVAYAEWLASRKGA